jgi:hypothetical protein
MTRPAQFRKFRPILVAGVTALIGAPAVSEEVCRSVSATWNTPAAAYRTQMWTTGERNCKKIEHTITENGDVSTLTGLDCNCDLKADGLEALINGAPHAANIAALTAMCRGPMAKPAAETLPARD